MEGSSPHLQCRTPNLAYISNILATVHSIVTTEPFNSNAEHWIPLPYICLRPPYPYLDRWTSTNDILFTAHSVNRRFHHRTPNSTAVHISLTAVPLIISFDRRSWHCVRRTLNPMANTESHPHLLRRTPNHTAIHTSLTAVLSSPSPN